MSATASILAAAKWIAVTPQTALFAGRDCSVSTFMADVRTFGQQEVLFVQTVVKSDKTTLKSAEIHENTLKRIKQHTMSYFKACSNSHIKQISNSG